MRLLVPLNDGQKYGTTARERAVDEEEGNCCVNQPRPCSASQIDVCNCALPDAPHDAAPK